MAQTRSKVVSLYKKLIRLGNSWVASVAQNTPKEREFILEETRNLFRANKDLDSPLKINEHVREAEARLTMAEHYRNPYPKPVNVPKGSYARKEGKKVGKSIKKKSDNSRPIYVKSIDHSE